MQRLAVALAPCTTNDGSARPVAGLRCQIYSARKEPSACCSRCVSQTCLSVSRQQPTQSFSSPSCSRTCRPSWQRSCRQAAGGSDPLPNQHSAGCFLSQFLAFQEHHCSASPPFLITKHCLAFVGLSNNQPDLPAVFTASKIQGFGQQCSSNKGSLLVAWCTLFDKTWSRHQHVMLAGCKKLMVSRTGAPLQLPIWC